MGEAILENDKKLEVETKDEILVKTHVWVSNQRAADSNLNLASAQDLEH